MYDAEMAIYEAPPGSILTPVSCSQMLLPANAMQFEVRSESRIRKKQSNHVDESSPSRARQSGICWYFDVFFQYLI
jgi:hypothetical protein